MSMPATCEKAVWALLDWNCGLDAGRTAFIPETGLLVSSFKVMSESSGKEHQIKTIISGATCEREDSDEELVSAVTEKRQENDNTLYKAIFASGEHRWLSARDFIDADGVVNGAWLAFADADDLEAAFSSFTETELKERLIKASFHLFTVY